MKIDFSNMPAGDHKTTFAIKYVLNILRTWYLFHLKFPCVKYSGFVRVMPHTRFAKRKIQLGRYVQFGKYCSVAANLVTGNYVLFAGKVSFVGGNDHQIHLSGTTIWQSPRGEERDIIVGNDVWIGNGCTILGGVTISDGAVIAAGAVVTKSVPACEVWGGVPAKKIKNRFSTDEEKVKHLNYLNTICHA